MNNNKKLYIIIAGLFPSDNSFRGSYIYDQAKAIERNSDYRVIVLKPTPFYKKDADYVFGGIDVYCFTDYNLPSNVWPHKLTDALSIRSMFKKLHEIGANVADIKFAHSHISRNGVFANALKRRNPNVKTMVQHHGFDVMSVTDGRLAEYNWHKKHCINYGVRISNEIDINIGVSKRTLDYVLQQPGINLKGSYVLYNGVDTSVFNPGDFRKPNEIFTIGCVANFWELKDQMTLIKAIRQLVMDGKTKIKAVFIGSGYTEESCRQYVENNNLSPFVEFRSEITHDALPDFYRSLDLFVLPSYWEAFGCVYTEAYACGVPFIGVKGQGIAEIIPEKDQNKWLIEKGDYKGLAAGIAYRMNHREQKQELSSPYDINVLISMYLEFLNPIQRD